MLHARLVFAYTTVTLCSPHVSTKKAPHVSDALLILLTLAFCGVKEPD
jgi:hypothetical protein